MATRRWLGAALLILLAAYPAGAAYAQPPDPAAQIDPSANLFQPGSPPIPPFEPGVVLMGMREGEVSAAALFDELQVLATESLDLRGLDGGQGTGGVTGLRLQVPPGQEWATIERLQQHPAVAFAEPNWIIQIAESPIANARESVQPAAIETPFTVSDTLYEDQWYLQRINMSRGWAVAEAMSQAGGDPIRVAIIDTGVDYGHPDLQGRLLKGYNYITPQPGDTPAVDDNGHGTHIAGLIGAVVDNNSGMAGTALAVELEPVKALDAAGEGFVSTIAQAIRDSAGTGADIINMSLAIRRDVDSSQLNTLRAAVNYAADRGALLIAAAGNCQAVGCRVSYPAALENVLAVGATSYADTPTPYSPVGPELDLVAPGGGSGISILSTWARLVADKCGGDLLQTVDGGIYCPKDGTSMAAALVTGVAAQLWYTNRDLSAEQVRGLLLQSAAPLDASATRVGAGRLDAAAAMRYTVPAQLFVSQNQFKLAYPQDSAPQRVSLTLENDSLDPIAWTLAPRRDLTWLASETPSGTVRYGEPAQTKLVITPTQLSPGVHSANLMLTSTYSGGITEERLLPVDVTIYAEMPPQSYLPLVTVADAARPTWLEPGPQGRTSLALSGSDDVGYRLPFAFELYGQAITETRIFADGFITFPADVIESSLPNRCFANWVQPGAGVYGWWADLDPGAGGEISIFQPDADRFVVEYDNIPSAAGVSPAYVVSFQIALHRSGRIDLNYREMPDDLLMPPQATVGVRVQAGRFYNQVACHAGDALLGSLPRTNESLSFEAKDLY